MAFDLVQHASLGLQELESALAAINFDRSADSAGFDDPTSSETRGGEAEQPIRNRVQEALEGTSPLQNADYADGWKAESMQEPAGKSCLLHHQQAKYKDAHV